MVFASGNAGVVAVVGLATLVNISGAESANDRLTVNLLGGDDVLDASGLTATGIALTADGGADDDVITGGDGADVLTRRQRRRCADRWAGGRFVR